MYHNLCTFSPTLVLNYLHLLTYIIIIIIIIIINIINILSYYKLVFLPECKKVHFYFLLEKIHVKNVLWHINMRSSYLLNK